MKKLFILLILPLFAFFKTFAQQIQVRELLAMAGLPQGNTSRNHFMNSIGFFMTYDNPASDSVQAIYIPKVEVTRKYKGHQKTIDYYRRDNSTFFLVHGFSKTEYIEGRQELATKGFVYDKTKDINKAPSLLFQQKNISILTYKDPDDTTGGFAFKVRIMKIPDSVIYADDLLQFDSHVFLASYFGEANVTNDLYYLSDKELKKCSVLFSGTPYQAAFVWGDDHNLDHLAYIIVSNVLPTKKGQKNGILEGDNKWKFKNGIHHGMTLREVLRLNQADFHIYGRTSDYSFMAIPQSGGIIDFEKTAVMFSCANCYNDAIFAQQEISALDIAKAKEPLHVFDIILHP